MRSLFIALLAAVHPFSCAGQEPLLKMDAALVNYNGKEMVLSGSVHIEHPFGKIHAQQVRTSADNSFSKFTMQDQISIFLKDKGELRCSAADIDSSALCGIFKGASAADRAFYIEPLFELSAQQFEVILKKEEKDHVIDSIVGKGDVEIDYSHELMGKGSKIHFKRIHNGSVATLTGGCVFTHPNGDHISAKQATLQLPGKKAVFLAPNGTLLSQNQPLTFSSETLIWEPQENTFLLEKNVIIQENALGTMTTDRLVRIQTNDQRIFQSLDSEGLTVLSHLDKEKDRTHTLVCHGKVHVDQAAKTTLMESPVEADGSVLSDKQVFFHDPYGKIYADRLTVHYREEDGKIRPEKIILEGQVRIQNQFNEATGNVDDMLQYALTDCAEYFFKTKEAVLSSHQPTRVLFYDKVHQLEVSAPTLNIRRDQATQKEIMQGMGDVRFQFVGNELNQLLERFRFEEDK